MLAVKFNFYRQFQLKNAYKNKLAGPSQKPPVKINFHMRFFLTKPHVEIMYFYRRFFKKSACRNNLKLNFLSFSNDLV